MQHAPSSYPAPGAPAPDPRPPAATLRPTAAPTPRLWRSTSDRLVAGVLGGLAEKFGLEPLPLRLLYGLLTLASGGLLAIPYLGVWYISATREPAHPGRRLWRSRSDKLVGGVVGGLAEKLGVHPTFARGVYAALTAATFGVPGLVLYLVLWTVVSPADPAED